MPLAAVITEPLIGGVANSYYYAGYSYVRLHGYNSTLDGSGHEIVDYRWNDGVGNVLTGPIVSFRSDAAGPKTFTLTVTDSAGATSTTQIVKTWNLFSGSEIYVAAAGSGGSDSNPGTIGSPYLTLDKAFTVAQAAHDALNTAVPGSDKGVPIRINLNRGDTINYGGGAFPSPCIVDAYGNGAAPKIRIAANQSLYSQQGTRWHNSWGYSVYAKNLYADWAAADPAGLIRVGATSPGSAIISLTLVKGKIDMDQGGGFTPLNTTCDGVDVSGATGGTGFGVGGANQFFGVLNSNVHGNAAGLFTGNAYLHGTIVEVRGNTFDGAGDSSVSALFSSGMQKYCIIGNTTKNAREGMGVGSNGSGDGSAEAQDAWVERNYIFSCTGDGLNLQYTNRGVVKNNIIDACQIGILLNHTSGHPAERTQNLKVYGNSIYDPVSQGIFTDGVRTIDLQDNIIYRTTAVNASDKKFIQLGSIAGDGTTDDFNFVTSDYNHFYSSAGDGSGANLFMIGSTNKTFPQWQGFGFDTHVTFGGDPLFTNPGAHNFSIQSASPCRNTGAILPQLFRDFLGFVRSTADALTDKGAYEFGSNDGSGSSSVLILSPVMSSGAAASPVVIPCASGSNQISPFLKGLLYGHSTHDLPAANFERWADVAANFACWGNGEPVSYTDEEGVSVGPHQGRVSSTKVGTSLPGQTNFLFDWFSRFVPKLTAFNTLLTDDAHESKPLTSGTGEERRYYYSPAFRRALYHPDATERLAGWSAVQSINRETIERRPFFHNSKNGNQGGPLPFTAKKGGPPEEINHNELDEFGNARSWNAVGSRANYAGDQWNAWDKQHNAGPTFHLPACLGSHAGMVNLWNNWRWVVTGFFPGSDGDSRGKQFDVPRSVGFGAFLAVYAYMAGFEWADPNLIKYHCGGNANGDGTGQNGNAGWKPSLYFEWLVKSALGTAVADNGKLQLMPKGFIYWNIGCDNLGEPSCLCDCANPPVPGPGKSGCSGAAWIGPDGVNYGSQTIGIDLWHAGIECSGLMLVDSLNDYLIKIWGPNGGVLTPTTAAGLKSLLSYASGEAVFRCVDAVDYATSHYYTGTAHAQSESPTTPRGYDQTVAQAMLDDMFVCHPEKAVDCALRQINDGSGKWIVAEKSRHKVDLFYSLSMPWLMYVLGPNNPLVKKWLSSGAYIPPPGQDGTTGTQRDNYEFHARFTDFAWAMNETGSAVFITNSTMAAGAAQDGFQSHPVTITASTMAAGAAQDGNYKKGFLLVGPTMSAGATAIGQGGHGSIINAGVMAASAAIDGSAQQGVSIPNVVMAAGAKILTIPAGGGSSAIIAGPNRMRAGAGFDFRSIHSGGGVVIPSSSMDVGAQFDGGTGVLWTLCDMAAGAALDGGGEGDQTFVLLNPEMLCGAGMRGGRPVIRYKNSFDASGVAIVVEG